MNFAQREAGKHFPCALMCRGTPNEQGGSPLLPLVTPLIAVT
jgi:hypothetical protein